MVMLATSKVTAIRAGVLKRILANIHSETVMLLGHGADGESGKATVSIIPLQRALSLPTVTVPSLMLSGQFERTALAHTDLFGQHPIPPFVNVGMLREHIAGINDAAAAYMGQTNVKKGSQLKPVKLCHLYIFPTAGLIPVMVLGDSACDDYRYLEIVNKANRLFINIEPNKPLI